MTPETVVDVDAGSDSNSKFAAGSLADHEIWAELFRKTPPKPVVGMVAFGSWVGGPIAVQLVEKDTQDGMTGISGPGPIPVELKMFV